MKFMKKYENDSKLLEQEIKKSEKLTREEVINRLENNKNLENLNLRDLDLSGLNFEGKSFRGSNIQGIKLWREELDEDDKIVEIRTNIKSADFIDATIATLEETFTDLGPGAFFGRVDAKGAIFGYTENLFSRRERHEKRYREFGEIPRAEDTGGLFNFNGSEGYFRKTRWVNADFGGSSGYEAVFTGADLSESIIEKSDLSGIDFSETNIDNIRIIDPISLKGMKINENQIESIIESIQLSNQTQQAEFLREKTEKGSKKFLEDYFQIVIVEIKN